MPSAYIPLASNEAGTITSNKTVGSGGVAALKDSRRDVMAVVSSATSPLHFNLDLGSAKTLKGIALLNLYATAALSVEIFSATASNYSGATSRFAATALPTTWPDSENVYLRPTQVSERYWRVSLTWSGSAVVSLGELVATSVETTLSRDYALGDGETPAVPMTEFATRSGLLVREALGGPRRTKRFTFGLLTRAQRIEIQTMWMAGACGSRPVLFVDSLGTAGDVTQLTDVATQPSRCIAGLLEPSFPWTQSDFRIYSPEELVLTELAPDARLPNG